MNWTGKRGTRNGRMTAVRVRGPGFRFPRRATAARRCGHSASSLQPASPTTAYRAVDMGSILLATLLGSGETLADLRSPMLPVPEDHPHLRSEPTTYAETLVEQQSRSRRHLPLTERSLRAYHLAWLIRQRDLRSRHLALCDARDKGWPSCWAGKVNTRHIRAVARALDEAHWVEDKLRKALVWCRAAAVPKAPVKTLLKSGKKRSVVTNHRGLSAPFRSRVYGHPSEPYMLTGLV